MPGSGAEAPESPAVLDLMNARREENPAALRAPAGGVAVVDIPAIDVSATRIRTARARGDSIRFLVPEAVHDIITAEDLYARDP